MPAWIVALVGIGFGGIGWLINYIVTQDRRITRLEERNSQLGDLIRRLPKRKGDEVEA